MVEDLAIVIEHDKAVALRLIENFTVLVVRSILTPIVRTPRCRRHCGAERFPRGCDRSLTRLLSRQPRRDLRVVGVS